MTGTTTTTGAADRIARAAALMGTAMSLPTTEEAADRYVRAAVPRNLRRLPVADLRRLSRTVRELRVEHRLSFPAIVAVLDLYEGHELTEGQVRDWCDRLGCPKNEAKAEKARAEHARRRGA